MTIKQLYEHINKQFIRLGYEPLNEMIFLEEITVLAYYGKVKIENGEIFINSL